jgi:AraC-like DNA-binding protein/ligand-binding sensor protein
MPESRQKDSNVMTASIRETDPLLILAWKVLSAYAKATGTIVCVLDQDFLPIPEIVDDVIGETNTCIHYCLKFSGGNTRINRISDMRNTHCNMMHINAIKEAHRFGGSYIYMCELGFMFWTSPIYSNGRLIGALMGSGFIGIDLQEALDAMRMMSGESVCDQELKTRLAIFPKGESEQIKSLAEVLQICAEYLSTGTGDYRDTLRWRTDSQPESNVLGDIQKNIRQPRRPAAGYPLDKERMLLAALRRGDNEAGKRILNELLSLLFYSNPDQFKFIQFRAIELVVLLSRAAINSGNTEDAMIETNNRYLRRIQEAKNIEELTDVLHISVERMAGQIFSFQGVRHASALRKAERFIWENYTRKISLQEIAAASGLSAPYFSTIFKEEMGENLSSYLNRLRVEKASHMLTETDLTLSEIAVACGFEDQSWFSKIFKNYIGISPGRYRGQGGNAADDALRQNRSSIYSE